jgi:hypothetical protein
MNNMQFETTTIKNMSLRSLWRYVTILEIIVIDKIKFYFPY